AGQVVMLSGEAGVGKSRLVQALRERTTGEPLWELDCHCSAYYQNSAMYPVVALLQRILRFSRRDEAEARLAKLEKALTRIGVSLPERFPLFAALLSLPDHDNYPALPMSSQRQRQKTFEAIFEWLWHSAQEAPVRVVMEDLQWADPSTLELLDF